MIHHDAATVTAFRSPQRQISETMLRPADDPALCSTSLPMHGSSLEEKLLFLHQHKQRREEECERYLGEMDAAMERAQLQRRLLQLQLQARRGGGLRPTRSGSLPVAATPTQSYHIEEDRDGDLPGNMQRTHSHPLPCSLGHLPTGSQSQPHSHTYSHAHSDTVHGTAAAFTTTNGWHRRTGSQQLEGSGSQWTRRQQRSSGSITAAGSHAKHNTVPPPSSVPDQSSWTPRIASPITDADDGDDGRTVPAYRIHRLSGGPLPLPATTSPAGTPSPPQINVSATLAGGLKQRRSRHRNVSVAHLEMPTARRSAACMSPLAGSASPTWIADISYYHSTASAPCSPDRGEAPRRQQMRTRQLARRRHPLSL